MKNQSNARKARNEANTAGNSPRQAASPAMPRMYRLEMFEMWVNVSITAMMSEIPATTARASRASRFTQRQFTATSLPSARLGKSRAVCPLNDVHVDVLGSGQDVPHDRTTHQLAQPGVRALTHHDLGHIVLVSVRRQRVGDVLAFSGDHLRAQLLGQGERLLHVLVGLG